MSVTVLLFGIGLYMMTAKLNNSSVYRIYLTFTVQTAFLIDGNIYSWHFLSFVFDELQLG